MYEYKAVYSLTRGARERKMQSCMDKAEFIAGGNTRADGGMTRQMIRRSGHDRKPAIDGTPPGGEIERRGQFI